MSQLYRGSQSYVKVPASKDGADPGTSLTVQIAIVTEGTHPETADLKTASWDTSTFTSGDVTYRYAQVLAAGSTGAATGAQDVTLVAGARYDVYIKITDFPEVPMLKAHDVLEVT